MTLDVTVVIPVKNEAINLPCCLGRLSAFENVLVVDSGSSDATREVARDQSAELLQFSWDGKFPKKRNWVLRNYDFKTEWVLFLDADEFVTEAFVAELERVLPTTPCAGFWLNYERWFLGKQLKHGDEFNKLALFRVGAGEYEKIDEDQWSQLDMEIHEHPILVGEVDKICAPIEHNEYRGLHHYIAKHNEYASWEAARYLQLTAKVDGKSAGRKVDNTNLTERQKKKYHYIAKWWAAPTYFVRSYFLKYGFLDGVAGFHFAFCKAVYFYQIRLKILELMRDR